MQPYNELFMKTMPFLIEKTKHKCYVLRPWRLKGSAKNNIFFFFKRKTYIQDIIKWNAVGWCCVTEIDWIYIKNEKKKTD